MHVTFGLFLDVRQGPSPANLFNTPVVGRLGFLSLLETYLGLSSPEVSTAKRVAIYSGLLQAHDNDARFYSESLQADSIGTAARLLAWRDEWRLGGWDGRTNPELPTRIQELASIEKAALETLPPGEAERLHLVVRVLSASGPGPIKSVHLVDSLEDFSLLWRQVLERLPGVEIRLPEPQGEGQLRAVQEQALAVLAGLPSASPRSGLLGTAEAIYVMACLRRMNDPNDTVASALVLTLAEGTPVETWLTDRLNHLATEGTKPHEWKTKGNDAHPLLARLEELRPALTALTPQEALRLASAESQVARLGGQWSSSAHEARNRLANVDALVQLGKAFEDECVAAKRPATVSGLLRWLDELAAEEDDNRAASADNSVSVLTYHGAKGLEWPVVVLTSLDATARSSLWGVRARTVGGFDPQQPLAVVSHHVVPVDAEAGSGRAIGSG